MSGHRPEPIPRTLEDAERIAKTLVGAVRLTEAESTALEILLDSLDPAARATTRLLVGVGDE